MFVARKCMSGVGGVGGVYNVDMRVAFWRVWGGGEYPHACLACRPARGFYKGGSGCLITLNVRIFVWWFGNF